MENNTFPITELHILYFDPLSLFLWLISFFFFFACNLPVKAHLSLHGYVYIFTKYAGIRLPEPSRVLLRQFLDRVHSITFQRPATP